LSDFFWCAKKTLYCLNHLKGQEGQLPNIRTILAAILTVPRQLRAQPAWYTSTASGFGRPGSKLNGTSLPVGYSRKEDQDRLCVRQNRYRTALRPVNSLANTLRFACYSQVPTGAYWCLPMPSVISIGIWLPASSVLSACCCLDRYCVHKSSATPRYNRTSNTASSLPPEKSDTLPYTLRCTASPRKGSRAARYLF